MMLKQGKKRRSSCARLFFAVEDIKQLRWGLALAGMLLPARSNGLLHLGDGAVFGLARALVAESHRPDDSVLRHPPERKLFGGNFPDDDAEGIRVRFVGVDRDVLLLLKRLRGRPACCAYVPE